MIYFAWILLALMVAWYLGVAVFIYHSFAFRFPNDLCLKMLTLFLLIVVPLSLVTFSYILAAIGGAA